MIVRLSSTLLALLVAATLALPGRASVQPIVIVPLDDRPVTLQLPVLLGEIAGEPVVAPPRALLGSYVRFGSPDAIIGWLNAGAPQHAGAYVVSADMLAYGGLVASRVPGPSYADAYFRLRELKTLRASRPAVWIAAFGTVMRLAPTGVPPIGDAAAFFAAYPVWPDIMRYANLHDPPLTDETLVAQQIAARIGPTLDAYLRTRARNYAVDRLLLEAAAARTIDRLVLGQDDAGPVGLHVREVRALLAYMDRLNIADRASIEPGADELGMALVANALARRSRWIPHVAVRYSTPSGASYQDPLEFAPIASTIASIVSLCGGVRDDERPDIALYVRLPRTGAALDDAFLSAAHTEASVRSVAVADIGFEESYASQGAFANALLTTGTASKLDAYAAWNTTANTVGTALAEAIAAGAGRRAGTYDALAHRTFTFMRFVDDVDYHVTVRPDLNRWLDAHGTTDHTYLLPQAAAAAADRNRALLWSDAQATLTQLYPGLHIAAMDVTLPWNRTFETGIDVRLAPSLSAAPAPER